jgi:hypothetical protein
VKVILSILCFELFVNDIVLKRENKREKRKKCNQIKLLSLQDMKRCFMRSLILIRVKPL